MNKITVSGLVVLAIGFVLIPAYAASPGSPLEQYQSGIAPEMITCDGDKLLMQSDSGRPYCVTKDTSIKLADRGFSLVSQPEETAPEDNTTDITSDEFLQYKEMYLQTGSAPRDIPSNSLHIEIEDYPEVGQTEKVRFVLDYGKRFPYASFDDPGDEFDIEYPIDYIHPPISMHLHTSEHLMLSNVKSNIHTDDPNNMELYSLGETVKSTAVPNTQYVIEADLRVEKEGFHNISGGVVYYFEELSGDNFKNNWIDRTEQKTFASTFKESASLSEYIEDGEIFADHTIPVVGELGEPTPKVSSNPRLFDIPQQAFEFDINNPPQEVDIWLEALAQWYIDQEDLTNQDLMDDFEYLAFFHEDIPAFLRNYMNYTADQIEEFSEGFGLDQGYYELSEEERYEMFLNGLAQVYLDESFSDEKIMEDFEMLEFTYSEMVDFLKNRMHYTEKQINEFPIDPKLKTQSAVTGQSHSFAVFGRVTTADYFFQSGTTPVHGIEVCAYDFSINNRQYVYTKLTRTTGQEACDYTSESGRYIISSIRNDDPFDDNGVDLVVRVSANGERNLQVVDSNNNEYTQNTRRMNNVESSKISLDILLRTSDGGAGRIINAISDARNFFQDHQIRPASLTVKWQHDRGAGVFSDKNDDGAAYSLSNNI